MLHHAPPVAASVDPRLRRFAVVFEITPRNLAAAVRFTGDADRVLVGLDSDCGRGTTPATLLPLLHLLSVEPDAELLVLLPPHGHAGAVYLGSAATLAELIRERASEWWTALTDLPPAERTVLPELPPSDLARDVLAPHLGPARPVPGHRATLHDLR
jgi:hypothetical protein